MLERIFVHDAYSFQKPVIARRSPAWTYLGVVDASQGLDLKNIKMPRYQPNFDINAISPSHCGGVPGQTNVFGRIAVPWIRGTGFPRIQLHGRDDEDSIVPESIVSDSFLSYAQCPEHSGRYLRMCENAEENEREYAEEANTAALLYWPRIVLCLVRAEEGSTKEFFSNLAAQLVVEDKLFGSLYQPSSIVEGIVDCMTKFQTRTTTAFSNMREAMGSQKSREEHGTISQDISDHVQAPVLSSHSKALQRRDRSTTLPGDPLRGTPQSVSSRTQSANGQITRLGRVMSRPSSQDLLDLSTRDPSFWLAQSLSPLELQDPLEEVSASNKFGDTTSTLIVKLKVPFLDLDKLRRTPHEAVVRKDRRQTKFARQAVVGSTDDGSESTKLNVNAHQNKKRKRTIEKDEESDTESDLKTDTASDSYSDVVSNIEADDESEYGSNHELEVDSDSDSDDDWTP